MQNNLSDKVFFRMDNMDEKQETSLQNLIIQTCKIPDFLTVSNTKKILIFEQWQKTTNPKFEQCNPRKKKY